MTNWKQLIFCFVAVYLVLVASSAPAETGRDAIGFYTAVSGLVTVEHAGDAHIFPVKLNDQVWFKDVIETRNESRTKAFFEDESVLTVGQNSRVEINEYVYQPEHNIRRAVVRLMQGQVRALVSKIFKANGSKFEVHTPSAVAAARGTYFTVWVENGRSGIINIGEKGRVDFTSGGKMVTVDPGFFSIAEEGSAPSVPMPYNIGVDNNKSASTMKSAEKRASTAILTHDRNDATTHQREKLELMPTSAPAGLSEALAAVEATTLRDVPIVELPVETLRALNVDARLIEALGTLTGLSNESLVSNGETAAFTTGTLTNGTLAVGSLSTATSGGGTLSVGSVSVGSTTVAPVTSTVGAITPVVSSVVAPLTPLISTVVAPVAPVTSTVLTPLAPVVSPVVAPVTTVISPIVAPVAPVISPVVAPLAPLLK
jgi:FecR protein